MTPLALGCDGQAQPTNSHSVVGAPQRSSGVLVADDEEAVRHILGVGMRSHGFTVWLAADGGEAVDLYREHCNGIDLVLLDVQMPNLDGPGTVIALREINPRVRCCFMTGDPGWYTEQMLVDLGALAVFRKPFRLSELARQLVRMAIPIDPDETRQEPHWDGDGGRGGTQMHDATNPVG